MKNAQESHTGDESYFHLNLQKAIQTRDHIYITLSIWQGGWKQIKNLSIWKEMEKA